MTIALNENHSIMYTHCRFLILRGSFFPRFNQLPFNRQNIKSQIPIFVIFLFMSAMEICDVQFFVNTTFLVRMSKNINRHHAFWIYFYCRIKRNVQSYIGNLICTFDKQSWNHIYSVIKKIDTLTALYF